MGYVLVFTAFLAAGHGKTFTQDCPDMACVEKVIEEARQSRALTRLRVFKQGEYQYNAVSMATSQPALIDLCYR